jgi:DtxR family Mn-dependent transcriptional regulator
MLGRPAVDPHGDPIPGREGEIARQTYPDLLSAPLNRGLIVARVTAQDAEFLRFIEQRNLKPGQRVEIETRDPASDSVTVRSETGEITTIGTRAASKVLVAPEP